MLIKGHSSCCCWFHWDFSWTMKLVLHSGLEGSAIGAACIESLCIETGVLDFCWKLHFFFFTVGCSCPCDTSSQCMQAQLARVMEPYIPVWQSTSGGSSPLLGGGEIAVFQLLWELRAFTEVPVLQVLWVTNDKLIGRRFLYGEAACSVAPAGIQQKLRTGLGAIVLQNDMLSITEQVFPFLELEGSCHAHGS